MFGSVCSGRQVQLATQVDTNKYAITIENGLKVSHVAIFFLPDVQLDPAFSALIYFQLPNKDFKLFGSVSSLKPSAIFKLNNSSSQASRLIDDVDMDTDEAPVSTDPSDSIVVGISIETTEEAERLLQQSKDEQAAATSQLTITNGTGALSPSDPTRTALLAGKIVKHAYNYLASFIDDQGKVSIKFFDSWWEKFRTRLQNDPKFLDNQED